MKELFKNKKFIIGIVIGLIIIIAAIVTIILVTNKNNKETKELKEQTYTMYVSINPLVKLVFRETYYECLNDFGEKTICSGIDNQVIDYTLLNDDAKDFYQELDFKGKSYIDSLIMLCDVARDNDVGFKSIDLVTDYKEANRKDIIDAIKKDSKYTVDFDVFVDIQEHLKEDEVIENLEQEVKIFTIKFDANGGNKIDDRLVKENTPLEDIETPTRNGYKFICWELDGKNFDPNTLITKDITLKAKWQKEDKKTEDKPDNKEEVITKTLTIKNPKLKGINLYSDAKVIAEANIYSYENTLKVTVEGIKSKVDKITATNIELGVDMSSYKTAAHSISSNMIVINPIDGITYKIDKPKVAFQIFIKKKVESTIDKINLNENILVTEWYRTSSYCGSMYITTNFKEVFKDYIASGYPNYLGISLDEDYDGSKGTISESKFKELSSQLIPNKVKINEIAKKFENIKNNKYKNFTNLEYKYDENSGTFWYNYNYLIITDYEIYKLPQEFDKYDPVPEVLNDPSISYTEGPCGDSYGGGELLTEELCSKYNLNCSRW